MDKISLNFIKEKLRNSHTENSISRKKANNSKFDEICQEFLEFLKNERNSDEISETEKKIIDLSSKVIEKVINLPKNLEHDSIESKVEEKEEFSENNIKVVPNFDTDLKPNNENCDKNYNCDVSEIFDKNGFEKDEIFGRNEILQNSFYSDKISDHKIMKSNNIFPKTEFNQVKFKYKSVKHIKSDKRFNKNYDRNLVMDTCQKSHFEINGSIFQKYHKSTPFAFVSRVKSFQALPNVSDDPHIFPYFRAHSSCLYL